MSKQVRFRRGTTAQHAAFTGIEGEVTVDTEPVKSFFDPKSNCSACLFANNNRKIKEFSSWNITEKTTQNLIQHVNFP